MLKLILKIKKLKLNMINLNPMEYIEKLWIFFSKKIWMETKIKLKILF